MLTQEHVLETSQYLKNKIGAMPLVGIVLGTGMNTLAGQVTDAQVFPYDLLPHFPKATVSFHKGQLVFGYISGVPVVILQGRFHFYEGYSMQQLTFPVRVLHALGIRYFFTSNAAGGLNPAYKKGDLVVLEDHINLLPDNPLRGLGDAFGNRFVDMSAPYDVCLATAFETIVKAENLSPKKGVYVAVMGPNLETRAEYRWLRNTGADMVGMSTIPEIIVARQLGLPCLAVSVITDECEPDNLQPVNISEIIEVAGKADIQLTAIFVKLLHEISAWVF